MLLLEFFNRRLALWLYDFLCHIVFFQLFFQIRLHLRTVPKYLLLDLFYCKTALFLQLIINCLLYLQLTLRVVVAVIFFVDLLYRTGHDIQLCLLGHGRMTFKKQFRKIVFLFSIYFKLLFRQNDIPVGKIDQKGFCQLLSLRRQDRFLQNNIVQIAAFLRRLRGMRIRGLIIQF